jgi:hypothetical protein
LVFPNCYLFPCFFMRFSLYSLEDFWRIFIGREIFPFFFMDSVCKFSMTINYWETRLLHMAWYNGRLQRWFLQSGVKNDLGLCVTPGSHICMVVFGHSYGYYQVKLIIHLEQGTVGKKRRLHLMEALFVLTS